MTWNVYLTRKAHKQLLKLPQTIQDLADLAISDIQEQGLTPRGWNCLKTGTNEYRLRLNYRYRMRYRTMIEPQSGQSFTEIDIFYIGHRQEAYR